MLEVYDDWFSKKVLSWDLLSLVGFIFRKVCVAFGAEVSLDNTVNSNRRAPVTLCPRTAPERLRTDWFWRGADGLHEEWHGEFGRAREQTVWRMILVNVMNEHYTMTLRGQISRTKHKSYTVQCTDHF